MSIQSMTTVACTMAWPDGRTKLFSLDVKEGKELLGKDGVGFKVRDNYGGYAHAIDIIFFIIVIYTKFKETS